MYVLSCFSRVQLFVTLWAVACQAPLSMGFSRQKYWSELPLPSPGDLPNSGIEPASLMSPVLAGGFFTTSATWEAPKVLTLGLRKCDAENVRPSLTLLSGLGCGLHLPSNRTS